MWQVSEATIKRWADAGHLQFSRTLGGHRRFALGEVVKFQTERGLGVTAKTSVAATSGGPHERVGLNHDAAATEEFLETTTGGQEGAATAVLLEAYLNGVPVVNILDETITGAMHRVGKLWHGGEMSVADEHLATQTARRAIEGLRAAVNRKNPRAPTAVCCATESEFHEVSVLCAQVLLESEGWNVKNLGAHTPFFALTDAVEKHHPQLICVSSTTHGEFDRSAREYQQFHAAARGCGARVVLGGAGFQDETTRQRFPADLYAENFNQLLEFIRAES